MGEKAEEFLEESKTKSIMQKKQNKIRDKAKRSFMSQIMGYFIIIIGVLYTTYRFDSQKIELTTTIILIFVSLLFGGIFILIGKHYG